MGWTVVRDPPHYIICNMASNDGGYDYQFVETPPDDLICMICTCVAREPQQLVCCGRVFCRDCLSNQRKYWNNCPQCRRPSDGFNDTRSDRNIKELKVKCGNIGRGCSWTGELRSIEEHHKSCDYSSIQCPNRCLQGIKDVYLLRKNLRDHLERKCPKRPHKCPHCNETGEYQERTTTHLEECPQVEVSCGNIGCKETVVRYQLKAHHSSCPFELLDCEHCSLGCKQRLLRKDLRKHVQENCPKRRYKCRHCKEVGQYDVITGGHLNTCPQVEVPCPNQPQGCLNNSLRCKVEQHRHVCKFERVACKYAEIGCNSRLKRKDMPAHENNVQEHFPIAMETIRTLKQKVDSTSVEVCPFHFKLSGFNEQKTRNIVFGSKPFYTHPRGYRICIRVYANGNKDSKDTNVSVYACLMKGKNDDNLPWPFTGTVSIRLLNQLENKNHHMMQVQFESNGCGLRVQGDKERGMGSGYRDFIPHADLGYDYTKHCQYLKDNRLYFRVDAIIDRGWLLC